MNWRRRPPTSHEVIVNTIAPTTTRTGPPRAPQRPAWAPPARPGLPTPGGEQLIAALSTPYQAQRGAALYVARGGPPTRKPAGGHPPALTLAEQVLVTVLRQRFRTPQPVLAELFGVATATIAKAERQARPLLEPHGHHIEPARPPTTTQPPLT